MAGTAGFEAGGEDGDHQDGGMDPEVLKAGLLMEAAEAQQKAAQDAVNRFDTVARALVPLIERSIERGLTRHVDAAVREAVSRMAAEELKQVQEEAKRAAFSLQRLRDQAQQGVTWNTGWLAALVAVLTAFTVVCFLFLLDWLPGRTMPSRQVSAPAAHAGLRGDPAVLAEMERRGLAVDVSFCGDKRRVCVRVDPKAGLQGVQKDQAALGRN